MSNKKLSLVCKDQQMLDDASLIIFSSGKLKGEEIECWEEKTWDVRYKTGTIEPKVLFVGAIKDTTPLSCFVDIRYERWGVTYGTNPRYAVITSDPVYIKDSARYEVFLEEYRESLGSIFAPEKKNTATNVVKTVGTVGLAVATRGASLVAQKIYDDNKANIEKNYKLCLYGVWHFTENCLDEFLED